MKCRNSDILVRAGVEFFPPFVRYMKTFQLRVKTMKVLDMISEVQ